MKMKYFRFLFGEIGQYFVHLGELKDTRTDEHFTFMYLRKAERHVSQVKGTEHTLFLCPKAIDMLILGRNDISMDRELEAFFEGVTIKTLLIPEKCRTETWLSGKARQVVKVGALKDDVYCVERAGWHFYVRRCDDQSVMLIHGPGQGSKYGHDQKGEAEIASVQNSDFERKRAGELFEDCVMNVKTVDGSNRCCMKSSPDAYGCALGCVLHRDHDICRCHGYDDTSYMLGTVMLPTIPDSDDWEKLEEYRESLDGIRFFGISDMKGNVKELEGKLCSPESGYRQYFVGMDGELGDSTIAEIGRGGLQRRVAVLRPGQGLCCSGFLKYAADEK